MTSVPEITRILARIQDWKDGHGQAMGRAEASRRLDEAHKLLGRDQQPAGRDAADHAGRQIAALLNTPCRAVAGAEARERDDQVFGGQICTARCELRDSARPSCVGVLVDTNAHPPEAHCTVMPYGSATASRSVSTTVLPDHSDSMSRA
jgi:hypothetical protein